MERVLVYFEARFPSMNILPPADNDDDDFAQAMRDVARKPSPNRAVPHRKPLSGRALQREADERAVLDELLAHDPEEFPETGEHLSYRAEGLQESAFRRLRRGTYRVEAELDLHGMNSEQAKVALHDFLVDALGQGLRCVRIIHGKGLRSSHQGPVLKARVDRWLRRTKQVLAFVSARPHHGGTGAIYVLLRAGSRGD